MVKWGILGTGSIAKTFAKALNESNQSELSAVASRSDKNANEFSSLFNCLGYSDYQELMKLGSDYGKFDREGKKMFIDTMEALMDRYRVFMKRFELSEDFQAKMTVEQLRTQLGQFGMTPEQMFDQMNMTLNRMKSQLDQTAG